MGKLKDYRETLAVARELVEPHGLTATLRLGTPHNSIEIWGGDKRLKRLTFASSARTKNHETWMRQSVQRWMRAAGLGCAP